MDTKKIVTIVVDASAGFIVTLTGFKMTPFPFDIMWGAFNIWLWIVSPSVILWAKNKDANNLLN